MVTQQQQHCLWVFARFGVFLLNTNTYKETLLPYRETTCAHCDDYDSPLRPPSVCDRISPATSCSLPFESAAEQQIQPCCYQNISISLTFELQLKWNLVSQSSHQFDWETDRKNCEYYEETPWLSCTQGWSLSNSSVAHTFKYWNYCETAACETAV